MIPRFSPEVEALVLAGIAADRTYPQIAEHIRSTGIEFSPKSISKIVRRAISEGVTSQATRIDSGASPLGNVDSIVQAVIDRLNGNPAASRPVVETSGAAEVRMPDPERGSRVLNISDRRLERVAWISDLHHPFHDRTAISIAMQALRDYEPDCLVIGGDYFDCYSISDHDRDPGRCDYLQDEFDSAKETTAEIRDLCRKGEIPTYFIDGNHEERLDRLKRKIPALAKLDALTLPNAAKLPEEWVYLRNQSRLKMGPLSAIHGDLRNRGCAIENPAGMMLKKLRTSVVFGHVHRFQTYMQTTDDGTVRGAYAIGHLSDVQEAKYITSPDWQSGFATIDFDWGRNVFSVSSHMIIRGSLRWGRTTYAPTAA